MEEKGVEGGKGGALLPTGEGRGGKGGKVEQGGEERAVGWKGR